jgi:hypothetical protein
LPLVVGGGGPEDQSVTPFIEIPTSRNTFEGSEGIGTNSSADR